MRILSIDTGTMCSGMVLYDTESKDIIAIYLLNTGILRQITFGDVAATADVCVMEMVGHYGSAQPVGKEVFQTCIWFGQFQREWERRSEEQGVISNPAIWMLRKTVAANLCGTARAKGSHIHKALEDRFGPGRAKAVGTKENPGPLYKLANYGRLNGQPGITGHLWDALAVAVTYAEMEKVN